MRRVLLISPHFPPDSSAGTHRARLLAPHLASFGWEPTVLTCRTDAYEGTLDQELTALVHGDVRVVRAPAIPARLTRRLAIGDLGLRSLPGLYRAAVRLLATESFDAVFITIFPAYTALLGPLLSRRFGIPFVLDYQDPWVNVWGKDVGGGRDGRVDLKSRASRFLAEHLEPWAVRAAAAITAVSAGTFEPILVRNPGIAPLTEVIPIGAEPRDFTTPRREHLAEAQTDGVRRILCAGTILPLGFETLRALLRAMARLQAERPELYRRLRLEFVGTSNQTTPASVARVLPLARDLGVDDAIAETPTRLPYSQTLRMQVEASALLALGSSEHHYTASKIFPLLLARRPLLAIYHEASTVTQVLRRIARPPSIQLVTYCDDRRAETKVPEIADALARIAECPVWREGDVDQAALSGFHADRLAGKLAGVLDRVVARRAA